MKVWAISANSMLEMFNRQFLKISGYSDEEIIALGDLSAISPDRLTELQNTKSMQSLGLSWQVYNQQDGLRLSTV